MNNNQFESGDYFIRRSGDFARVEYIGRACSCSLGEMLSAKILIAFSNEYDVGSVVQPYLRACQKISEEEISFYLVQNDNSER